MSIFLNPYTPPVNFGEDNYGILIIFIAVISLIISVIVTLIGISIHNVRKHEQKQKQSDNTVDCSSETLGKEEIHIIKAFRASKGFSGAAPTTMQELTEEEKQLIEQYRKRL